MSDYSIFTQWRHHLHFDHAADVREWFGYFRYDTCHDADIGMALNGMSWQGVFDDMRKQIQPLRRGFVPKASELALAIARDSRSFQEMHMCRPAAIGKTEATSVRVTHPDKLTAPRFERTTLPRELPDDVLIAAGGSTYRCKPGEKLRGQPVAFNEVELHVDELLKLIQDNPPWPPIGTNDMQFSANQIVPQPQDSPWTRTYEEILAAAQKIEAWRAAERARHLTDAQVMQLCLHFKLYSLQAIEQFIQEYQR